LCGAGRLVQEAFGSYFGITGGATDLVLNLAAEVSSRSL
jgi:hypothetical protein